MKLPRDSNATELAAFDATCERLAGFDGALSSEFVDGFLTALAALPGLPPPGDWLPALAGDTFERTFADPADHAQALKSLTTRLSVVADQLDAEALDADPQAMRLNPLVSEWTEDERARVIAEDRLSADEAATLQTGADWAGGFTRAFAALGAHRAAESDAGEDDMTALAGMLAQVQALTLAPGSEEAQAHEAKYLPGPPAATRDHWFGAACYAVQDLRLWFVDMAPRPQTRRVEAAPGRNEPCWCGSGKKFKRCHGG